VSKAQELAKEIIAIVEHYKNYSGDFHDARLRQVAAKLEQYAIFDKPTGSVPQISSWSG